jgi:hypothetical protein
VRPSSLDPRSLKKKRGHQGAHFLQRKEIQMIIFIHLVAKQLRFRQNPSGAQLFKETTPTVVNYF